ncbi:MAG: hypothetical protein HFE39_09740 [Clostridiales bacterium]|jgi:hypothetical protein|nr:hypothetical protein [Clostridiales bacterium]
MKTKKRTIVIVVACILTAALGIGGFLIYEQVRPSRQSDFPPPRDSALLGLSIRSDLKEQVESADLVIQGTVTKVLEPIEVDVPAAVPEEYTDIMGGGASKVTYFGFEITVLDAIKGNPGAETIQLNVNENNIEAIPPLTEGMNMIFCLNKKQHYGDYGIISETDGFFYVAKDDKVYPADPSGYMERISGMDLSALKEEMRGYVKE